MVVSIPDPGVDPGFEIGGCPKCARKAVSNKLLVYHPKSLKKSERGGGFFFYFLINFRGFFCTFCIFLGIFCTFLLYFC